MRSQHENDTGQIKFLTNIESKKEWNIQVQVYLGYS
jgi:hypothetical protein